MQVTDPGLRGLACGRYDEPHKIWRSHANHALQVAVQVCILDPGGRHLGNATRWTDQICLSVSALSQWAHGYDEQHYISASPELPDHFPAPSVLSVLPDPSKRLGS
jgi:hypothetical protein